MRLVDVVHDLGQRAFVGKVCMDRNAPDFYRESTLQSASQTLKFVQAVQQRGHARIEPVVTPRFVPTCSSDLMSALGQIAATFNVPIQVSCCDCVYVCVYVVCMSVCMSGGRERERERERESTVCCSRVLQFLIVVLTLRGSISP